MSIKYVGAPTWMLSFLLVAGLTWLKAENGRDFSGRYAVSNVIEATGMVTATVTVRLMNHSGREVQGARLLLHGLAQDKVLAASVNLADHAEQTVKAKVSIPAREFAQWQRRGPTLLIESKDAGGAMTRRPVELIRAIAIAEEQ